MIRRNVDLQARLLEELFDFTKIGQHKVKMRLEPIDAHEAVGFVLEICKADISAANITVLLDLHSGGLGLGLFIAKGMVEAQGGTLTVTSEGRDKGAMFCVTLAPAP